MDEEEYAVVGEGGDGEDEEEAGEPAAGRRSPSAVGIGDRCGIEGLGGFVFKSEAFDPPFSSWAKSMARWSCDYRYLLLVAAVAFIYIQVEAENRCTSQMRSLIDQISMQQGRIVALEGLVFKFKQLAVLSCVDLWEELYMVKDEVSHQLRVEERKRQDQECGQLKSLVQDLERKGLKKLIGKAQVPVASVVVMACNRADYLERTIKSILKYQQSVASKFPLFVSQDGSNPDVRKHALSYDQLIYMQHLDFEPVHPENSGEIVAYYKIAHDMEISPDFFDYFEAGATLLDRDNNTLSLGLFSWSWMDAFQIYMG
ncbi:hypothetical protein RJ639_020695 [Escallonia herrerae]|uniref:Alpha-1,3-mannosyl-glycoprotein 2-beta-N-acetylglucosaminyltransferase n=1 Tax=Escallonia herrerae TaxID=1293975 RepID=A0AA88V315_9ASTE|nr:hypothetical protein RJ639_020695 [Escallonia herrerae]